MKLIPSFNDVCIFFFIIRKWSIKLSFTPLCPLLIENTYKNINKSFFRLEHQMSTKMIYNEINYVCSLHNLGFLVHRRFLATVSLFIENIYFGCYIFNFSLLCLYTFEMFISILYLWFQVSIFRDIMKKFGNIDTNI